MTATANPVAGSPGVNSFINGQMARQFTGSGPASEYAYPIGKVISGQPVYKDMAVQPTTVSGTTTFTSEYFPTPHPAPSVLLAPGMVGIVQEYWQVDQGGGTAAAKVKIPYLNPGNGNWIGANNDPVPDPCSACNVAVVRKDVNTNGWNFTASSGNFSSSGPEYRHYLDNGYIYSASNISFGPFTNGFAYHTILPVTILNFDAKLGNGNGMVSWKLADDKDPDHFELQHSQDGESFTALGLITAKPGTLNYSFVHHNLPGGLHYYRLLVKEKTGKEFYSKIVLLKVPVALTQIVGIRPNPARNETFLSVYSVKPQAVRIQLFDIAGRAISSSKILVAEGQNQNSISTSLLPPGIYNIRVSTEDGVLGNLRLVKE
jgi:hypothetical protein